MAIYDTWASGFFDDLAMALYRGAGKFFEWSDATKEHWIGKYVIFPFTERLGDLLETGALAVWGASDRLAEVHNLLQGLLSGWLLSDLLDGLLHNWHTFKDDPVYWVFCRLVDFWPEFYWLAQDPVYMVSFWVGERWGDFWDVLDDSSHWVLTRLDQAWPEFYWLRQNPTWTIRCWFVDAWPDIDGLFTEPDYWLKERLSDMWGVPVSFWDDPIGGLQERLAIDLERALYDQRDKLYRTGEHVLRYFIEGVW